MLSVKGYVLRGPETSACDLLLDLGGVGWGWNSDPFSSTCGAAELAAATKC